MLGGLVKPAIGFAVRGEIRENAAPRFCDSKDCDSKVYDLRVFDSFVCNDVDG